jgi:hypothetical protein
MQDPAHDLDGTGKKLRHLKVYDQRDLNKRKIVSFIKQSISLLKKQLSIHLQLLPFIDCKGCTKKI